MKPFKTFKGLALSASAILFLASCSKSVQEIDGQNQRDVNQLSGHDCDIVVNLESWRNRPGFFFVGDKTNMANRQNFSMGTFTENDFFDVTSNVGTPWHDMASGSIGVAGPAQTGRAQRSIGAGESLWLTLSSTTFAGQLLSAFDVVLNGSSATAGTIELYKGAELVETITIAPSTATAQNFGISFQSPFGPIPAEFKFFDQIRFNCSAGDYRIYGPQSNGGPGLLPPTKFYVANVAEAVYMRNRNSTGSPTAVRYINQGKYPYELDVTLRQTKSALADNVLGSGEYNNLNADKWLKLSTNSGNQLVFNDGRIGVGNLSENSLYWGAINSSQELIIEPGTDFPSTHFSGIEIRQAVTPGFETTSDSRLDWVIYDGMTMVGSGSTNSTNNTYNFINPGVKFDKIVFTGRTATSRSGLGRFSDETISAYPACN